MRFDILTVFPEMFVSPIGCSIQKRATENGILSYHIHNIRDYSTYKHKNTDDYPFGGGNGMVMLAQPIYDCINEVINQDSERPYCIMMTPRGRMLTTKAAKDLSKKKRILLLCGHYEGIDERVMELMDDEISIGDYVLTGGELPAMVLCDCISRFIPGVLGTSESADDESFSMFGGLLEYPQYSRPSVFNDMSVPEVLLNGNHADIECWRRRQAIIKTAQNRPDLIESAHLSNQELCLAQRYMSSINLEYYSIVKIAINDKRSLCVYTNKQFININDKCETLHWNKNGYVYANRIKKPIDSLKNIIIQIQLLYGTVLYVSQNTIFENIEEKHIQKIINSDII